MEGNGREHAPLTEPQIVSCIFVSGIEVTADDGVMRLVGWVSLPYIGGETTERRIVLRIVLPPRVGQSLGAKLRAMARRLS